MNNKLRVIDSTEGFENLRDEWNKLYIECQNTTIFLSWDWMYTWWEVFNKSINSDLFILTLYEKERLIGIAPFHIINSFPKSLIQGKTLSFIGFGENKEDKIVSQYFDFIVADENQEQLISSVSKYLIDEKKKWDFADFTFLLEDSVVSQCFQKDNLKIQTNISQYGNRFYIPPMQHFDDFIAKLGNRWSKMYRNKNRKLEASGLTKIESVENIEDARTAFKQLSKMHKARWKNRTKLNIFNSELFNEFHLKILERLVPQNKASIKTLCVDGNALACYYYFTDKSQIHYYQSGFYSENANRYSPLFLLICKEIGSSIKNKRVFDFMFDENQASYKKEQYAAQSIPMYRLICSPYKSRMIKHRYAKSIQMKYLKLKSFLIAA